jgi:hypothetical protein
VLGALTLLAAMITGNTLSHKRFRIGAVAAVPDTTNRVAERLMGVEKSSSA